MLKLRLVAFPVMMIAFSAVILLVGENVQEDQSASSDPQVAAVPSPMKRTLKTYIVPEELSVPTTTAPAIPTPQEKEHTVVKHRFSEHLELIETLPQEERVPLPFSTALKFTEFDTVRPTQATAATENRVLAQVEAPVSEPVEETTIQPTAEIAQPTAVPEPEPVVEEVIPEPIPTEVPPTVIPEP